MLAAPQFTFLPHPVVPSAGRLAVYSPTCQEPDEAALRAAAQRGRLGQGMADRARIAVLPDAQGPSGCPAIREVGVHAIGLDAALRGLLSLGEDHGPAYRRHPDSLRVWALAARLGWRLAVTHQFAPTLAFDEAGGVHGVWRALAHGDADANAIAARLVAAMPPASHAVALDEQAVWRPEDLLAAFLDAVVDLAGRSGSPNPRSGRPRARILPWTARWAEALADSEDSRVPLGTDAPDLVAGVGAWHAATGDEAGGAVTELRLLAPDEQDAEWILDFGVRTESGELLTAAEVWRRGTQDDGENAAVVAQEALLNGLGRCARVFPPMESALAQAVPEQVHLGLDDAWLFISEAAPLLDAAGLVFHLPQDLSERGFWVPLRVAAGADADSDDALSAEIDPDQPLSGEVAYHWEVALAEDALSEEELADLMSADAPLVRWRGRWVRIDPDAAERLRGLGEPGTLALSEAIALALAGTQPGDWDGHMSSGEETEVVADGGVARLLERIAGAADSPPVPSTPAGFTGELRPYQRRGVAWLEGMGALGMGAVLADDMGLGKTIQLIAHVLRRGGEGPHLIVCPTSVVGNWEREFARFAPGVETFRHHGPDRPTDLGAPHGVYLTTYGTLRRDVEALAAIRWDVVTLDEAQHVKNPATAGAKAVRKLNARHTIAMTGTPLENRLTELWSLMDVVNPGLLGTRARFAHRFATPIEKRRDRVAATRLRRLVAPFILRREKTDPEVIADLPEKIERTVVCPLTPEQATLYEEAVAKALDGGGLEAASAMERRGRILALLTRLKQICNHPAQALGQTPPLVLTGRSGKLATAREIVAEAVDAGDRVLVFSQYVSMGRLLASQLAADLATEIPLLHGGVAAGARDRMVASFQGEGDGPQPPVLVVSLRAGGTGLNLTAATHVVHYDRWWNPAVEDQATDRAHRIGQRRTVEVHKLVTAGTVEERIAEVLERKRALAETVVGAGEAWVTELTDDELADLVALGVDASITELDDDDRPWDLDNPSYEAAS